ncbi:hypothetical protein DFJ73DRAFT_846144 [Zopfochytrium polystomum]|nr:hypothetical protein DFJ73DRAFT_846144 [Zopfochytrium polystomum]
MGILIRLRLPESVPVFKVGRVVDLLRLAQARHYRLASYIDPETMIAHRFCEKAKDLPCSYRFVKREKEDTWKSVYEQELNTNFDVLNTSKPLWRSVIILPDELMPKDGPVLAGATELVAANVSPTFVPNPDTTGDMFGRVSPAIVEGRPYFEIMFTFHHCLGDGLSMFAYARTYLEKADAEHMNSDDLHLENVPVTNEPPPILDNLFEPNFFEILPEATGTLFRAAFGKKGKRFKGHKTDSDEPKAERPTAVVAGAPKRAPSPSPSRNSEQVASEDSLVASAIVHAIQSTHRAGDDADAKSMHSTFAGRSDPKNNGSVQLHPTASSMPALDVVVNPERPLKTAYTRVRFLWFPEEFVTALRKRSKPEGTTIAAVLVVAALAAVRTSFEADPKYKTKPLPTHQGWVVTNSLRHMLPQSKLLEGGEKQADEGLKMFGGYAGSVTNSSLKLIDTSDAWERCRSVRKSIATVFRAAITRMKLMNYCYRHPKLWAMIEKRTDLSKLSRSYSVEVANLGAWDYPAAPPNAGPEDLRLRLDNFGGVVNSSFDGVRGLFTLGVITLGGNMSVAVGYDMASVHESDADSFEKALCTALKRMKESKGKITVADIRKV